MVDMVIGRVEEENGLHAQEPVNIYFSLRHFHSADPPLSPCVVLIVPFACYNWATQLAVNGDNNIRVVHSTCCNL